MADAAWSDPPSSPYPAAAAVGTVAALAQCIPSISSPEQLAEWAAAVDASLQLLPGMLSLAAGQPLPRRPPADPSGRGANRWPAAAAAHGTACRALLRTGCRAAAGAAAEPGPPAVPPARDSLPGRALPAGLHPSTEGGSARPGTPRLYPQPVPELLRPSQGSSQCSGQQGRVHCS